MPKPYFRQVPDFDYVSRISGAKNISDYVQTKNLFRRVKLRPDIFKDIQYFQEYTIKGNERPDNVAYKFYDEATLDWVVLLSNNILNVQSEWPLTQSQFDEYLMQKYGSEENLYTGIHHYETIEILNSEGTRIVSQGLIANQDYSISYFDSMTGLQEVASNITVGVTNYDYESNIEDKKRNIYVLKSEYLRIIFDDIENLMPYKKGSSQYVTETLKRGENIRLYQ
jgi:hypothetical protein